MKFLDRILAQKQKEVDAHKAAISIEALKKETAPATRSLAKALQAQGMSIISEVKRKSPSKGILRPDLEPIPYARMYEKNGASAISVLTDTEFFAGTPEDLKGVRQEVSIPVLRKDFIIDPHQIYASRSMGADAILLIARILTFEQLRDYLALARELSMDALVEIHGDAELEMALKAGAKIIGVNSRDLDTFQVDLNTAVRLRKQMPNDCVSVAESGIRTHEDLLWLRESGFDAALIGETLVKAPDPGKKLYELIHGQGTSA